MGVVQHLLERVTRCDGAGGVPVSHSRPAPGGRGRALGPRGSDGQGTTQELDAFEKSGGVGYRFLVHEFHKPVTLVHARAPIAR